MVDNRARSQCSELEMEFIISERGCRMLLVILENMVVQTSEQMDKFLFGTAKCGLIY